MNLTGCFLYDYGSWSCPVPVPAQVRHHIHNWDLDVSHDFDNRLPTVALSKKLKFATLSASYDLSAREAALQYSRRGLRLGAKLARIQGTGWKAPALYMHVEPLGLS